MAMKKTVSLQQVMKSISEDLDVCQDLPDLGTELRCHLLGMLSGVTDPIIRSI